MLRLLQPCWSLSTGSAGNTPSGLTVFAMPAFGLQRHRINDIDHPDLEIGLGFR